MTTFDMLVDGRHCVGSYETDADDVITVSLDGRTKSTQLGGHPSDSRQGGQSVKTENNCPAMLTPRPDLDDDASAVAVLANGLAKLGEG